MFARVVAVTAAVLFASTTIATASDLKCTNPTRLSGEVKSGNDFVRALPGGLAFALRAERNAPPKPYGWKISVYPAATPNVDLVWAANPPYTGMNVRDLTLSFGQTADMVVAKNPRNFAFFTDAETNAQAQAFLYKQEGAPAEIPVAPGHGEFKIDSHTFITLGSTKAIGSMKFHVALCLTN